MPIREITVIGAGLIGGSIIKALRKHNDLIIKCMDINIENINDAKKDGMVVNGFDSIEQSVSSSDLIFICTPVMDIPGVVKAIKPWLKKGAIITDVGSTKNWLFNKIAEQMPDTAYFIGGHPMAGSEKSGYKNSSEDILINATYILIPEPDTPKELIEDMKRVINLTGACPIIMDKIIHDSSVAAISHLPYIVSICLSCTLSNLEEQETLMKISAGSLRDMTRISDSSIRMWRDICMTNKYEIKDILKSFKEELDNIINIIDEGKYEVIEDKIKKAKLFRQRLARVKGL